ncbi:uncharacterized protein LOC114828201 [Galendromus occidentalis]|uniref:Uncharacterized protein LOC114828201 n=1 Tax=Galendromus occidentalis TaxID=34638 RepID=A0AAJ7SFJ4_9ACAR|nr:uncharacterized protein LOC114828201 [Galendromus occidentalis]
MFFRSLTTLALIPALLGLCQAVVLEGTDKDAEFLSAVTKDFSDKKSSPPSIPVESFSRDAAAAATSATGNSSAAAFASQVTSALSQIDLGLGIYKMCPFPFSYLHQCEGSSDCPDSDCCGMYAFPGPNRWRRSCCVPDGVTTIARVARLCIKDSDKKNTNTPSSPPSGGPKPLSATLQDVVAQALGVNTAGSDADLDLDDDDDVKKL